MESRIALIAGALAAIWVGAMLSRALTSPLRHIPGPWHTRFTSLPLLFYTIAGRRIFFVDALHRAHGAVVRVAPAEVSVCDPAAVKQIYAIGTRLEKTAWYQAFAMADAALGLFELRDTAVHGRRRKLLAGPLSKSRIRSTWEGAMKALTGAAVDKLQRVSARDGKVDVAWWWRMMTADVAGRLVFGENFGMVESGEKNEYMEAMNVLMVVGGINAELPWLVRLLQLIPLPGLRRYVNYRDVLDKYNRSAVENAYKHQGEQIIFSGMVGGKESLTDEEIMVEATDLAIAGTDTTSISLTFMVWAILSRPELQCQLEEEVAALPEDFTDAQVEELPLLNAVINESMRLWGPSQGTFPRSSPSGGITLGGYYIPEGVTVGAQSYTVHRLESLFKNANEFDPTRWYEPMPELARACYMPFGAGSRTCLGIHFAHIEMRLALAHFFRRCRGAKLAPSTTPQSMSFVNYFNVWPKSGKCELILPPLESSRPSGSGISS